MRWTIPVSALLCCSIQTVALAADPVDLRQASRQVVEATNEFRNDQGLSKLKVEQSLQKTAQKFADFMAESGKYGHHADDRTPAERATASGYKYCVIRENIAYRTDPRELQAQDLAQHFTDGWIDSPEHRDNMLADFVTETAVAMATKDGETFYAVQLFGRPESAAYKVSLANESESEWTIQIVSNGGSDEIEVPPGGTLRMKRCLPVTLKIVGTEAKKRLKGSANVAIEQGENGPTFKSR